MTNADAAALGLGGCSLCGLISRVTPTDRGLCPRCGTSLPLRRRHGLGRTAALLLAAALLFVPANVLPMMTTTTLVRSHSDTILTGVAALWRAGAWPLAIVVFLASVVVPTLKIAALGLLVTTTRWSSDWRRAERTRLYRLVERVGRWSMLDIFVMAVLAALVRSRMAGVEIGPGAPLFAAVVVLTMFASLTFDPRLIWQTARAQGRRTS